MTKSPLPPVRDDFMKLSYDERDVLLYRVINGITPGAPFIRRGARALLLEHYIERLPASEGKFPLSSILLGAKVEHAGARADELPPLVPNKELLEKLRAHIPGGDDPAWGATRELHL